jgi:hypothetical protein
MNTTTINPETGEAPKPTKPSAPQHLFNPWKEYITTPPVGNDLVSQF